MNAKRSLLFTALAALPLAIASNTAQAQSYEMVIATQLPEDMSNNEIYPALVHFKNLVEARTDGDLEVTIFGGGQLGSEVENGSEVQGGRTLQSTIMSAGAMSSFYGKLVILYLFDRVCGRMSLVSTIRGGHLW